LGRRQLEAVLARLAAEAAKAGKKEGASLWRRYFLLCAIPRLTGVLL